LFQIVCMSSHQTQTFGLFIAFAFFVAAQMTDSSGDFSLNLHGSAYSHEIRDGMDRFAAVAETSGQEGREPTYIGAEKVASRLGNG
jgi:hypothetical protein